MRGYCIPRYRSSIIIDFLYLQIASPTHPVPHQVMSADEKKIILWRNFIVKYLCCITQENCFIIIKKWWNYLTCLEFLGERVGNEFTWGYSEATWWVPEIFADTVWILPRGICDLTCSVCAVYVKSATTSKIYSLWRVGRNIRLLREKCLPTSNKNLYNLYNKLRIRIREKMFDYTMQEFINYVY